MVDLRPLLFINALALMLLVTAGFASVRDELRMTEVFEPPIMAQAVAAETNATGKPPAPAPAEPEPANTVQARTDARQPIVDATPFTVPPLPEASRYGPTPRRRPRWHPYQAQCPILLT